jgi:hypothetical protein
VFIFRDAANIYIISFVCTITAEDRALIVCVYYIYTVAPKEQYVFLVVV